MRTLITGASSGIGYALARAYARQGHDLVLIARREEKLRELAAEVARDGVHAEVVALDVGDTDAVVAKLRALDAARPIDVVIANAGVGVPDGVTDLTSWEAIGPAFHTNFCGAAATLTALTGAMVARGRGHLVGIGSLSSFGALPLSAAYCSPKAGLGMLLECLELDLLDSGVAVTRVNLGFVKTPMLAKSTHPMPQLLEAEEAARRLVARLAGRPAEITLPEPLGAATRLAGKLPRAVRHLLARAGRRFR
jgi:short-subunit dehydrogenase